MTDEKTESPKAKKIPLFWGVGDVKAYIWGKGINLDWAG